jgi:AraC family transcriptional regulator, transcriptional activator of pobA
MIKRETIDHFHRRHGNQKEPTAPILIYKLEEYSISARSLYSRRDFYKIMLFEKVNGVLAYADKTLTVSDGALLFTNAMVPYSMEGNWENIKNYVCIFGEEFITPQFKQDSIADSALFKTGGQPVLYPNSNTFARIADIFALMLAEIRSDYSNKYDLLRNYVQIIIHTSTRISPPENRPAATTSASRISDLFAKLLEQQFPAGENENIPALKTANEFARRLNIHTNHLNKALREYTGKTTSEHINLQLIKQARSLLLHSKTSVASIAQSLGFNHASNFDAFFKKQTGQTPRQFRNKSVSNS